MEFNPLTGDLWVVCNDGRNLLMIGSEGVVGSKARTDLLKQEDDLPVVADDVDKVNIK